MSLIHNQAMTEENLAAKRANGSTSQGPVTPAGKANSAAANLRHGLYSRKRNEVLSALGEDPEEYADLMNSLEHNWVERLEGELVQRIGHTLWRMKRAENTQEKLALNRIQAVREAQQSAAGPRLVRAHENLDCYDDLGAALDRRSTGPTSDEIQTFVEHFRDDPSEEMQEFLSLLKPLKTLPKGPERKAACREARVRLRQMEESYRSVCIRFAEQVEEMQSPESLAALAAPQNDMALLAQKVEDSTLRQLWRLSNMLFRIGKGARKQRDVKNEDRTDYVYENTGGDDKMSS